MSAERIPSDRLPHDLLAERSVLGGILADNAVFAEVATLLQPEDFHLPGHAAIYEAFVTLQSSVPPQPLDAVTVTAALKTTSKLNSAGGPTYLAELEGGVPTTANTLSYARIVQEKALKRRLIGACAELTDIATDPGTELDEMLDEAQRRVFAIAEKHQEGDLKPFNVALDKTLELIEQACASGGQGVTGLSTGFADLDQMLTGLHPGELLILAARPGCGKTSLALNIATNAVLRSKVPAAVFSLEMPEDQLAMRLLSSETRIDMKRIRQGHLSPSHKEKLQHAASQLWNAPLFIDDSGSLSSFDLRTKVRRLQSKLSGMDPPQKLNLVVIDYLQLMHQRGSESRQQEVQEISRSLKALAKELSLPIIALSQLNRKVEERKGTKSKPMLSDLRESGAIEQDADVVMFIHREQEDSEEGGGGPPPPGGQGLEVELVVAKQRNGPTGSVPLLLFSEYTRFENKLRDGFAQ
ncbi:MAG: replicative DNA helicase [Deltaproteobacteria bacterium]|nr:replicative DNA helicase [Deltaproteobacteria bacterium]